MSLGFCYFPFLSSKYSLSSLFSNTFSQCSSFNLKDQVPPPYETRETLCWNFKVLTSDGIYLSPLIKWWQNPRLQFTDNISTTAAKGSSVHQLPSKLLPFIRTKITLGHQLTRSDKSRCSLSDDNCACQLKQKCACKAKVIHVQRLFEILLNNLII